MSALCCKATENEIDTVAIEQTVTLPASEVNNPTSVPYHGVDVVNQGAIFP